MSSVVHPNAFKVSLTPEISSDKYIMMNLKYKYERTAIKTIFIHRKPFIGKLWLHHHSAVGIKIVFA